MTHNPSATAKAEAALPRDGSQPTTGDLKMQASSVVFDSTAAEGVISDCTAPVYDWKNLKGPIAVKNTGPTAPQWTQVQGNDYDYGFTTNDECWFHYHLNHDWAGRDCFIHFHWTHNGTAITGPMVLTHHITYAKGHRQTVFPAEITVVQTVTIANIAAYPRYGHFTDEIQLSAAGGAGGLLDTALLEIDGIIKVHTVMTTLPTITGGGTARVLAITEDVHYQTNNRGSKNKSPPFHS